MKKWAAVSATMLIIAAFVPTIAMQQQQLEFQWFWSHWSGKPWPLQAFIILAYIVPFLPLILSIKASGKSYSAGLLILSSGILLYSLLLFDDAGLWTSMAAAVAAGNQLLLQITASLVQGPWMVLLPLFLLMLAAGTGNYLGQRLDYAVFPFTVIGFAALLYFIMMGIMMMMPVGDLHVFDLFLDSSVWTDAWFVPVTLIAITLFFLFSVVHVFTQTFYVPVSLMLQIIVMGIPAAALVVGVMINQTADELLVFISALIKITFGVCGVTFLLASSLCATVEQNANPHQAAAPRRPRERQPKPQDLEDTYQGYASSYPGRYDVDDLEETKIL